MRLITLYIVIDKYEQCIIKLHGVSTKHQLSDFLTKPVSKQTLQFLLSKLGIYDQYSLA